MAAFTAGVPFKSAAILAVYPQAQLALQAAFGADLSADEATWTWYDLTTRVRQNGGNLVNIGPIGRSDASGAQPAGLAAVLDDSDGNLTAYHPASQWYPYVRRNTPIRMLVNLTGDDADTSTRFFGYANGWPLSWQDDGKARIPVVNLTASGETRRPKQGKSEARSAIRRYLDTAANVPVAYWHLEDDDGALVAASGLTGGAPMTASGGGAAGAGVKFGVGQGRTQPAYTAFEVQRIGVKSFVSLAEGGTLTGTLPAGSGSTYTVQFIAFSWAYTGFVGGDIVLARWFTPGGSFVRYDVRQESLDGGTFLVGFNSAGVETKLADIPFAMVDEFVHTITITQNGGNVDTTFTAARVVSSGAFTGTDTDSRAGTFALPAGDIILNPNGTTADGSAIGGSENQKRDIRLGQLAVWYGTPTSITATTTDPETGLIYSPWGGYVGQNGVARLQRLADEHGITLTVVGTSSQAMGFLDVGVFLDLARETETADGGLLLDGLGRGYLYVTRDARYNQDPALSISAVAAQLAPPHAPQDNDQRDVNVFTATRKGGSSATYEDRDGPKGTAAIGIYDSGGGGTLNLYDDTPLPDYASWAVHIGTVEGYRFPTLTVDFTSPDVAPLAAAWLEVLPSSLAEVTNPSAVFAAHPPGDIGVLVEGWSERISPFVWDATLNCSPAAPWQVGELGGDERLDCNGSTLNEDLDTTETAIDVLITDLCSWGHADGDYPIVVDGEVMTVTAVGSVSSTMTFVAAGAGASANAASVSPGLPAGAASGNLLLVFATCRDTASIPDVPAGYLTLFDAGHARLFGKVHSGSESAPTVSYSGGTGDTVLAQMAAFTGNWGDLANQVVTAVWQENASTQHINYPAVDADVTTHLALWLGWKADDCTSVTQLSFATEIGEVTSTLGGDATIVWDYLLTPTPFLYPTGFFNVNGGAAAVSLGAVVILRAVRQTLTVTRSVNSIVKTHSIGAEVHVLNPITQAL